MKKTKNIIRGIQLVLQGKLEEICLLSTTTYFYAPTFLDRGDQKSGMIHIQKHLIRGSLKESDLYRLYPILRQQTYICGRHQKIYLVSQDEINASGQIAVLGFNQDRWRILTTFRARKKQIQKIIQDNSGGSPKSPSSNLLSKCPEQVGEKFPGPQNI